MLSGEKMKNDSGVLNVIEKFISQKYTEQLYNLITRNRNQYK